VIRAEHHEIDGATGFAEVSGDGTPVLCIHSAGQSGVQWREVLRALPHYEYRVIVADLPGHGRSDNLPGSPVRDLGVYSNWLAELLRRLDAERPLVVGCSIGGKIALELATDRRVDPRGVVAMAADAHNRRLSVRVLERSLEDAASPSRGDRTYFGTLACVGRSVPLERAHAIAAMHRREDAVVSAADLIAWTEHDLRSRLAEIKCPVRLVAGEDDFWIDLADVEWATAQIRDCIFEPLPGVGHYPMEEIEGFPSLLAGWLRELSAQTEKTS
jgi:pimeloyl-ACP methyl ester carboxylesterase